MERKAHSETNKMENFRSNFEKFCRAEQNVCFVPVEVFNNFSPKKFDNSFFVDIILEIGILFQK